jgi:hypothetical protein
MQIDLMNLSVPRQLRNMNFKDVKPEKVYDVDQVALICTTEKLPFLRQIVTSESKEQKALLFNAFSYLDDE